MIHLSDELSALAKDKAFLDGYSSWINHPMTQRMLELGKRASLPPGLAQRTGEDALYYSGQVDALQSLFFFLADLPGVVARSLQTAAAAAQTLETTYGAKRTPMKRESKS